MVTLCVSAKVPALKCSTPFSSIYQVLVPNWPLGVWLFTRVLVLVTSLGCFTFLASSFFVELFSFPSEVVKSFSTFDESTAFEVELSFSLVDGFSLWFSVVVGSVVETTWLSSLLVLFRLSLTYDWPACSLSVVLAAFEFGVVVAGLLFSVVPSFTLRLLSAFAVVAVCVVADWSGLFTTLACSTVFFADVASSTGVGFASCVFVVVDFVLVLQLGISVVVLFTVSAAAWVLTKSVPSATLITVKLQKIHFLPSLYIL